MKKIFFLIFYFLVSSKSYATLFQAAEKYIQRWNSLQAKKKKALVLMFNDYDNLVEKNYKVQATGELIAITASLIKRDFDFRQLISFVTGKKTLYEKLSTYADPQLDELIDYVLVMQIQQSKNRVN